MNDPENSTYTRDQGDWEPTRWYTVLGPDGQLWCESSDRAEAVAAMRPGDRLMRTWHRICRDSQMREEQPRTEPTLSTAVDPPDRESFAASPDQETP
ncbi:hypothetical protein [Nocardia asiatica]|uniref:hypothetical protein n=1 Tax=Nocardia asiatica TaxID=209252 RepID=UPI0024582581|nr:hypothetical protein [Nocardia asiatica]